MKNLFTPELKEIALGILSEVADFCEKNDIRYYLVCGTALGAVRHNGFIPWDDDIDIGMPRPDYERFAQMYHSEAFPLYTNQRDKKYPYTFGKVCDSKTILIEKNIQKPYPMGVYIDIFPMDGLPDDPQKRKKHLSRVDWHLRVLSWKRISTQKKIGSIHKIIQCIAKLVLAPIPISTLIRRFEKSLKRYDYESGKYVGHLVTRSYWGKTEKPREIFEPYYKHPFEDCEFRVPRDYHQYLTLEYGSYMELPPKEKQVTHHGFDAYWKSET